MPILYQAPVMLEEHHFSDIVCRELNLNDLPAPDMTEWNEMLARIENRSRTVRIALVGKYVRLHDAYLSVAEALRHGGFENSAQVDIDWVDSELLTSYNVDNYLHGADGIIVPGGFGDRGVAGMILAGQYARENDIPYFGICLGMQIAAIEFARNVLGYADANSTEFAPDTKHPSHRPDARPAGQPAQGRHDAPGCLPLRYPSRHADGARLRPEQYLRAPPSPL